MDKYKLLEKIKNNKHNTSFDDFVKCITKFGFVFISQKGSHKKFKKDKLEMILQKKGSKAKAYQIKQFSDLVSKYNL
jgi:predicted RNA binding protein YcfA (HicA-like mRNA interferase family)